MTTIDIHTHMFGYDWLEMIKKYGAPDFGFERMSDDRDYVMEMGAPACALEREAMDYDLRVRMMDKERIDISTTAPVSGRHRAFVLVAVLTHNMLGICRSQSDHQ